MTPKARAPWSFDEVRALNEWQRRGDVHPFTCGGDNNGQTCRQTLVATTKGWVCPDRCGYTQDWCHGFMLNATR